MFKVTNLPYWAFSFLLTVPNCRHVWETAIYIYCYILCSEAYHRLAMPKAPVETTEIFNKNLFNGKVLLCSGGGSGICRGMTEAMLRHGVKACIISRRFVLFPQSYEYMKVCI